MLSLTFWCLAMIAAVWWYYTVQKTEIEAASMREIFAVAAGKSTQVANWRRERIGDGHMLMSSSFLQGAGHLLSSPSATEPDRTHVLDVMRRMTDAFLYTDAVIVDLDGNPRLGLHTDPADMSESAKSFRAALARGANKTNDVVLSDLNPGIRTKAPRMWLTVPVHDLGALILEIDPERFLYPFVENWPGSSRTAEALLVRLEGRDVVYLNRRRQAPKLAPFSRRPAPVHLPPDAVLDAGWSLHTVDYRGIRVIGTVRRIAGSPWFVICKMDIAEVDAPLRRLGWEMALITTLIGLANAAGVGLIWRGRQARILHEKEAWYHAVANDTPAYLWMASAGEENSFINRPFQKFLGTDRQTLSDTWVDYLHPDDAGRAHATYLEDIAQARGSTEEFRIRRFDGEYRTVISEAVPRLSPDGSLLGFAGSVIDITERRMAEEQLRAANARLQTELAERVRKELEIQTLNARLIGAREDERKRLARELHDDLNQQIAAVSLAVGNLKRHLPLELVDVRSQSDRIHQKLVQLAETVRRMSHELHPALLEYQGLTAALHACCEDFAALAHIQMSFHASGPLDSVPPSIALCIYRITQEALQNVSKHANASAGRVELSHLHGILRLTVSDNGIGMEPGIVEAKAGLGLLSIRERARLEGGCVEIRTQPNRGTTVTVNIPVANAAAHPPPLIM